ncbi:MAG: nicotianamine synthase family protein [Actinomycetota bacterium]
MAPALLRRLRGDSAALAPSPSINRTLTELVSTLLRPGVTPDVVAESCRLLDEVPTLRRRARAIRRAAALAEDSMERHYAARLADAPRSTADPSVRLRAALSAFPYGDNYQRLVAAELRAVQPLRSGRQVAFCGAGPLPLSAIIWHQLTGDDVTLIDVDAGAMTLAAGVIEHLARFDAVDRQALPMLTADGASVEYRPYGTVFVASLVPKQTLDAIATAIACSGHDCILAVRSAYGLTARLAYDHVAPRRLEALGLEHLGTVVPDGSIPVTSIDGVPEDSGRRLGIAPAEVLNTTDLYRPRRASSSLSRP